MTCDCERGESRHHHAFGGTYPCEGQSCPRCRPLEERERDTVTDLGRGLAASLGVIDETWSTWTDTP